MNVPRYTHHLFICENQRENDHPRGSCIQNGSGNLKAAFKQALKERGLLASIRPNGAGCLDACEYGPVVVVYPEGVWYGGVKESDVEEIIDVHLIGGQPVHRLMIRDPKFGQPPVTSPSPPEK